jgi:hypothetical protein
MPPFFDILCKNFFFAAASIENDGLHVKAILAAKYSSAGRNLPALLFIQGYARSIIIFFFQST